VTDAGIAVRGDRWLRAVVYGFLAELMTVLTIIATVMSYRFLFARGLSDADYAAFGMVTGKTLGTVGGTLFTFLFAHRLMPLLPHRFVEHGLVVAVAAIAFSVGGSLAGHHGLPDGYLLASILKLTAGALAGSVYSRSISRNRNVV
jgi:vacuolar-type H+-ATPase subunit I/STV1